MDPRPREVALSPPFLPQALPPGRERAEPGVEPVARPAEGGQEGVLEDPGREDRIVLPGERLDQFLDGGPDDIEEPGRARSFGQLEVPPLTDLRSGATHRLLREGDGRQFPKVVREVVGFVDDEVDPFRTDAQPLEQRAPDVRVEEERVGRRDEAGVRDELLRELVRTEVLLATEALELGRVRKLGTEPLDQSLEVGLEDPGVVGAAVQVGEVDLTSLGQLVGRGQRGLPLHRPFGRPLSVGAELAVLLRSRPLHFGDVLEQEATAGAPLQADREDRPFHAVRDRPGLVEDLDLLGVGPDEVEDPVVGEGRVFEQGGQGRDRLAAPRRGVEEERPPTGRERAHLPEDRLLARPHPVGKEEGGLWGGRRRRRRGCSGSFEPSVRVLSCGSTGTVRRGGSAARAASAVGVPEPRTGPAEGSR